jgi:hypothetical protein
MLTHKTPAHPVHFEGKLSKVSVRSNSLISRGFKSRPGSCPYTSVAQGSGVLVTGGRKFPIGKAAGRNESEPTRSLVKLKWRCRPCGHKGKADVTGRENGSSLCNLPG